MPEKKEEEKARHLSSWLQQYDFGLQIVLLFEGIMGQFMSSKSGLFSHRPSMADFAGCLTCGWYHFWMIFTMFTITITK